VFRVWDRIRSCQGENTSTSSLSINTELSSITPIRHAGNDGHDRLVHLHPKEAYQPKVHRDFGLILQEWSLLPNNTVPNTMAMEFNWLTINGRSGPPARPC